MIPIQKMKFWTCQEERGLKLVRKGEGKWEEVGGEKARGDAKWERGKERGKKNGYPKNPRDGRSHPEQSKQGGN